MNELPVCRHFIACERIEQTADRAITLHRLSSRVVPRPGESFPLARQGQCFLGVLASGKGQHTCWVEYWGGVGPSELLIWTSPLGTIEMGSDPLALRIVTFRFDLKFDTPGQFEFRLMCDGRQLASLFLDSLER